MKPVRTAARTMLASIFVVSGVRVLLRPDDEAETARPLTDRVAPLLERADPRVPTDPRTLVRIKAASDVIAGLALATGHLTRPAAAVLAANLIPAAVLDWGAGGDDRTTRLLRNLGLLGGLLLAAADTEGRPGLRYRTGHAVDRSRRSVRRVARTARREARIAARSASAARRLPG